MDSPLLMCELAALWQAKPLVIMIVDVDYIDLYLEALLVHYVGSNVVRNMSIVNDKRMAKVEYMNLRLLPLSIFCRICKLLSPSQLPCKSKSTGCIMGKVIILTLKSL